ncbi:hypothetical protein [Streptomyces sp. NPDC056165]|uniref:hypothetical protein n=1 Tax=Streptomyces sp. NPDC056165 TaxID=3345733 RepID=UPI0035DE3156
MTEDYAAGGLVPRPERIPVERWTNLRLISPPDPNPHPMRDDMDEWVASFVAAAGSPFRGRPSPAPTGSPELDAMVQYLRDCWAEEREAATAAHAKGSLADLHSKEMLLGFFRLSELYGHAVRILLQRYAENDDFPDSWRLSNPAGPGSMSQGEGQQ